MAVQDREEHKAAIFKANNAKNKAKNAAKKAERAGNALDKQRLNSGDKRTKKGKQNKKANRAKFAGNNNAGGKQNKKKEKKKKKVKHLLKVWDTCPKYKPSSNFMCDASTLLSKCYYGKSCQISDGVCQRENECACVLLTGETTGTFECTKQDVCTACSNPTTGTKKPTSTKPPTLRPTLQATDVNGPTNVPITATTSTVGPTDDTAGPTKAPITTTTSVPRVNDDACPPEEPEMGVFVTCEDNLRCYYGEMECECAKLISSGMWMCKIP
eukprot:scaffold23476_cov53-Attheya_sp.AAC.1